MEEEAEKYFEQIEALGGVIPAIKENFFQKEIANASYKFQKDVENKRRIIVGVNEYVSEVQPQTEILKIGEDVEKKQIEKLNTLKSKRNEEDAQNALKKVEEIAKTNENLIPYILDAVKKYCSVGEIIQAMKNVFGIYREDSIF